MTVSTLPNANFKHPLYTIVNRLLQPVRQGFEAIEIRDRHKAKLLCKFIPANCPFERYIAIFGHQLFHIPPLCKLNPFYEQFVGLRFRALCFLADECGEDISEYFH